MGHLLGRARMRETGGVVVEGGEKERGLGAGKGVGIHCGKWRRSRRRKRRNRRRVIEREKGGLERIDEPDC